MKPILITVLIGVLIGNVMSACTKGSGTSAARSSATSLTEDERHRLYAAALAVSEFPLESETFKEVCKKIGIFDAQGNPSDDYMGFVNLHLKWAMKPETQDFKQQIDTKQKAAEYVKNHLLSSK